MADIQVRNVPQTLPTGWCPATEQDRLNTFFQYVVSSLSIDATVLNLGSSVPSPDNQNRPWLRTLAVDGSFDGLYTFVDGKWRRPHPDFVGKVVLWEGDIATINSLDGGDGTANTGQVAAGAMWAEVTEAKGRFPIHPDPTPTVLTTAVAVGGTGGAEKVALSLTEMPSHSHTHIWTIGAGQPLMAPPTLLQVGNDTSTSTLPTGGDPANGNATAPHNNMPPYYGIYLIRRTARKYYVV